MTVMGLLPSAVRLCEGAETSTRNALFGQAVMSQIKANAATVTNMLVWKDYNEFTNHLAAGDIPGLGQLCFSTPTRLAFPSAEKATNLVYKLEVAYLNPTTYAVTLKIGKTVYVFARPDDSDDVQDLFYDELVYMGL